MAPTAQMGVFVALVVVMATSILVGVSATGKPCSDISQITFPVTGRKFHLQNPKNPVPISNPPCPEGKPASSLTFCKKSQVVKLVGNFVALENLGVCSPDVYQYAVPPGTVITYEQYFDQVVFRIPGRATPSFRALRVGRKKLALGLSSHEVTTLVDVGPANC